MPHVTCVFPRKRLTPTETVEARNQLCMESSPQAEGKWGQWDAGGLFGGVSSALSAARNSVSIFPACCAV